MCLHKSDILIVLLVLCIGGFYIATIRDGHNWGGDFSMYIHHAKNIAEGIEYHDTGYIYNPFVPSWSPRAYPPIFPILLSPIYALFALDLRVMKIEIILFFLLFLYCFYLNFRTRLPLAYVFAAILTIGCNPFFWDFKDNVLSDIPFLFWVTLSLLLIQRAYDEPKPKGLRILQSIAIGFFIYLALGTRTIGIVLLPCLIIFDLIKSRKFSRTASIATLTTLLLLAFQGLFFSGSNDYLDQLTGAPEILLRNLHRKIPKNRLRADKRRDCP